MLTATKLDSTVEEICFRLTHLRKSQAIDEIDDFLKRGLDNLATATDNAKTQNRALPQILVATFCDGDIKLVGYPRLNSPENPSLSFQRVVLSKNKTQLQNPHDHGGRGGLGMPSYYRLSPAEARDASRPPGVGLMRRITGKRS